MAIQTQGRRRMPQLGLQQGWQVVLLAHRRRLVNAVLPRYPGSRTLGLRVPGRVVYATPLSLTAPRDAIRLVRGGQRDLPFLLVRKTPDFGTS